MCGLAQHWEPLPVVMIPKPVWDALAKGDVKSCCRFRNVQAGLLGDVFLFLRSFLGICCWR